MLKELRTQHRNIIQMSFNGYRNKEIAERLEMSDCNVSTILRSPLGQAYLEGLQDKSQQATLDVRKQLVSLNKGALEVLARVMNPAEKAPHTVQLSAAKDVLDRTGYKAPDRLHVDMTMQTKTDLEIDAEINAMQQSIEKTYLVSPGKAEEADETVTETQNEAFTDEQPDKSSLSVDATELDALINLAVASDNLDSSGQSVNSPKGCDQQSVLSDISTESSNSPTPVNLAPEESILTNIPSDLFKV